MSRSLATALEWSADGTVAVMKTVSALEDGALDAPSRLPGWTRKHVVAHVAANADALANLVRWAATGDPTPMYSSPEERAAGIESGAAMGVGALRSWLSTSSDKLGAAMHALADEQWRSEVVTAQGRTVMATEVPWMRAREVWVHAVDLDAGVELTDLPANFLVALCDDVVAKRSLAPGPAVVLTSPDGVTRWQLPGDVPPVVVWGPIPELTAYLTGRAHHLEPSPPQLTAWL
jgi:maleylpyruvate isomerase